MTASDILPVLVNTTQTLIVTLGDFEVFDNITMLQVLIGFACFTVIGKFIIWLRTRGGRSEGGQI